MRTTQLAIVGGGPAGLSAAVEAAKLGVSSIVLDENAQPGGQIYRQLPAEFRIVNEQRLGKQHEDGKYLLEEVAKFRSQIDIWNDSLAWGYFGEKELAILRNGKAEVLKADQIVIASGTYDRPLPFPGWTLPGVLTAGCVQVMIKSQRVLPGTRFLLAGSGPLQLAVADQLLTAGAKIVAIVEATSTTRILRYLPSLLRQPGPVSDGFKYLAKLKFHGVPYIQSHIIIKASGSEEVEQAIIAAIDNDWKPILGTERTFDVDVICLGYGLVPNTDLTRLCGCAHRYCELLGGWIPEYDERMETSVPGIFVAGDGCGVMGVNSAIQQGRLAGIYAMRNLGLADDASAERLAEPVRRKLRTLRKFAMALGELYSLRAGIYGLAADDTVVCRCEEISLGTIRNVIRSGADNVDDIKRRTRAGMGYCQGRMCVPSIMAIAQRETGSGPEHVWYMKARSPVKPIPMSAFLE
jgi:NADPH-dependent 2,4-dienoyl-CoA reductase/sulfur reductase-like enzyme